MSDRQKELKDLTSGFIDAFNRQNIDEVVGFFAEDAVYEDSRGDTHIGPNAIRTAFMPLVCGDRGQIQFYEEDYFAEVGTDKIMASWTLSMDIGGERKKMRGMDILRFRGNKLVQKSAYCKSSAPRLDDA